MVSGLCLTVREDLLSRFMCFVRQMELEDCFSQFALLYKRPARERIDEGRFAHYGSLEDATSVEPEHIVSFVNSRIFATASEP
jgi:hypothetical protein